MWIKFASDGGGYLNTENVTAFDVNTVSSSSHLIMARSLDGTTRALDNVGYQTVAEALQAIRQIVSGVTET